MFKRRPLFKLIMFILMITSAFLAKIVVAANGDYDVDGGRKIIDFNNPEDINQFLLFTEFDKQMWIMDDKLFAYTLCEQKAILKDKIFTDIDVCVDISTINTKGKFDSGIYIGAKNIGPNIDQIDAWNVNVEHGAGQNTYYLKLHRFINGRWDGIRVEISGIPYTSNTIKLRVVVKGEMLYAFLNKDVKPRITYNIGLIQGYVGLRSFYSPNTFDNFSVIGNCIEVNREELNKKIEEANNLLTLNLTTNSIERINHGLNLANTAITQKEIDFAIKTLKNAIESVEQHSDYVSLTELINEITAMENPDYTIYTKNSWDSLMEVLKICKTLTEDSSEELISYWYNRLSTRKQGLIAYIKG